MNLEEIKKHSLENKIQVAMDDSLIYICNLINGNKYFKILEIGSGLGYSSQYISLNSSINYILSIEKNVEQFLFIKNNISNNKINFINCDAFTYENFEYFDLIFIDGPKNKQEILFDKYSKFLNKNGVIIIDNIYMKNLQKKQQNKRIKNIIFKNEIFKDYLLSLSSWNIIFLDIGDGIAVCKKK